MAAVVVAVLFFLEGAIHLHPLSVPAALASGLLGTQSSGPASTNAVTSDVVGILEMLVYTVAHLMTFAAVGISAAFVLDGARFWRSVWGGAGYAAAACTALLYIVRWIAGTPVALDVVGLPRVLLANTLAGAIIGIAIYAAEHGPNHDAAR